MNVRYQLTRPISSSDSIKFLLFLSHVHFTPHLTRHIWPERQARTAPPDDANHKDTSAAAALRRSRQQSPPHPTRMLSAAALRRGTTTSIRIPRAPLRSYTRPHIPSVSPPLRRNYSQKTKSDDSPHSFFSKLSSSMRNTKIEWFHIPIGLGIAAVGFTQIRKRHSASTSDPSSHGPLPERAVRPMGAWYPPHGRILSSDY